MGTDKLHPDSEVYYDNPNPHKEVFGLYWDNDVVYLTKVDADILISLLESWLAE